MDSGKILIIEDNEKDSDFFSKLLEEKGYNVSCAFNGKDGLRRLKQEKFDLLLLDLLLPDIKGEDIYSKLRRARRSKDMPVIVLSIKDEADEIEELFQKGLDDYIIKPPRPSYLLSRIETHLTKRRLKR